MTEGIAARRGVDQDGAKKNASVLTRGEGKT